MSAAFLSASHPSPTRPFAAPSTGLLEPYMTHPTPVLLFVNPHAKGHYFLPPSIQQLLLLLDGLLLLTLPFYAIGVTYHWCSQQSADQSGGSDVLSTMFGSVCGVLHFTLFIVYIVVLVSLLSHQARHALVPQVAVSTLSFTYLVSAITLIMVSDGCWTDSVVDRCELAMCCILCCRIFLHLCLCLFLIVEYAKYLLSLTPAHHTAHQPSVPLSALYSRHPSQEPFPSLAPPTMRYLPVYASGLSEDELGRLDVCGWTKAASDGGRAAAEGERDEVGGAGREGMVEGEEEGMVCSICICGYEEGAGVVWLPCGHVHHAECIRVWLSLRSVCPECRNEVMPTARQQRLAVAESV